MYRIVRLLVQSCAMAFVQADRQLVAHEYEYTMDNDCTGNVYLLDGPEHEQLVSFKSSRTGLRTGWHGSWNISMTNRGNELILHFDCEGREWLAAHKVAHMQPTVVPVRLDLPVLVLSGLDHEYRLIQMMHIRTWTLDPLSAAFVVQR